MHKRVKSILAILIVILFFGWFGFYKTNFFPFLSQLILERGVNLNQMNGKINVLLLGIGSNQADEPDLTDTIIFASINVNKNTVSLISIPRDLWMPDLNNKINTAYVIGELNKKGLSLAKNEVSKIVGQPIQYGLRLNFNGFMKAVDLIGGLDISVDRAFDDYSYPLAGKEDDPCGHTDTEIASLSAQIASGSASEFDAFPCRYIHIHFDKGLNHMDGKTALEFVRSRHAEGIEGTDFARSARQEKIIKSFKNKLLSPTTLFNPVKLVGLYATIKSNIDTDIPQDQLDDFIRLGGKLRNAKIESAVIDYGDPQTKRAGLLMHPDVSSNYKYEWVLIPRIGNGSFQEIQGYVDCEIMVGDCSISPIQ